MKDNKPLASNLAVDEYPKVQYYLADGVPSLGLGPELVPVLDYGDVEDD